MKLEQIVDIASMTKEDRERYDESIKVYRDNLAVIEYQRAEGERIGQERGRAEGERNALINVALTMLKNGSPIDYVSTITGLSRAEIETLMAK